MRKAAVAHLESIVEDGNPRVEEASVCSRKTTTFSGGGGQLPERRRAFHTAAAQAKVRGVLSFSRIKPTPLNNLHIYKQGKIRRLDPTLKFTLL